MREADFRRQPFESDGDGSAASSPIVVHEGPLHIERTDRLDYGRKEGAYRSYVYSFATYAITHGARRFTARRYEDTWSEVSLFGDPPFTAIPYDDASFCAAARYFFGLDDVKEVRAFTGEYVTVDRRYIDAS
ncbi:MAG: hypothetical protein JNM17_33955 [Archangium sp.]|nr:hypothetical protein [Archangium sp.]